MARLLVYFLIITGLAAFITWFLTLDGEIEARVFGYAISGPVDITLIFVLIFLILFGGLVWLTNYLMRLPGKVQGRREEGQRRRGMVALSRGLEAVAAGDPEDAQKHARAARRQLNEPALTRLLTAQAAQLAGDEKTAEENFSAMLEAPETEFLGLRGLYLQALASGDQAAAKGYADRAFKLRPNARWAFESVYQLSLDRGSWGEAQAALKLAGQHGIAEGEPVRRKEAALLTARAYAAEAAGENDDALKDLRAALKLAPGFSPAAALAANLEGGKGNTSRAARILEDAWAIRSHPALVKAYENLYDEDPLPKRTDRLIRLANMAPDRDESRLLIAQQYILREAWEDAKPILEELLLRTPNARTFTAMAETMRGLHGDEAARPWFAKAAAAPLEPVPGVDGEFHFTTDGWRRIINEFGDHDRLAPPPLEEISGALSRDEVRLLTAPPPEPAPEIEPEPAPVLPEQPKDGAPADKAAADISPDEGETKTSGDDSNVDEKADDDADKAEREVYLPPDAVITGLPEKEEKKA